MIRKKTYYYYDPETCTYVPRVVTGQVIVRKVVLWIVFVLGTVLGAQYGFDQFFLRFQQAEHLDRKAGLMAVLSEQNQKLDVYDARLNDYYQKSNSLYRTVVGNAQIPLSYWKGGRGGSSRYDRTDNSEVNRTWVRLERLSHQVELLGKSYDEVMSNAEVREADLRNTPSIMPVNGELISSFGYRRHPVSGHQKLHEGVDFACQIGTPIYAPGDGVVESSGYVGSGYGINVNINHKNGYKTKFAHMSKVNVTDGQSVKRGQLIGYSGNTGLSTGPHLHYEIMLNDTKIDPIDFFYQDLPPTEYRRLRLNKTEVTKEAVKASLADAPAMD